MLKIMQLSALSDNYIYLLHDTESKQTAVVDPSDANVVLTALTKEGLQLHYIFNTHHHSDHVDGNRVLKQQTGCKIIGSEIDRHRIPGIDVGVEDNSTLALGTLTATVIATPGHTHGHLAFYFRDDKVLFCGDTLFVMGCGRLFEGTAETMWQSLQKLKALPPETKVYCAHEYSQNNGRFALTVEPDNVALQQKMILIEQQRKDNQATVPSTIQEELATNPFFREHSVSLQTNSGATSKDPVAIFAHIRRLKDRF